MNARELKAIKLKKRRDSENTPICKHFGCGQILTFKEQLYGDLCIIHSILGKTINKRNGKAQKI
jgi:hypothetical protein